MLNLKTTGKITKFVIIYFSDNHEQIKFDHFRNSAFFYQVIIPKTSTTIL